MERRKITIARLRSGVNYKRPLDHIIDSFCYLLDRFQNNTISMARTTGFTCTAVANLVLEKKFTKLGISPPEFLGSSFEYVNNYLLQRGVVYKVCKSQF